MKANSSDDAAWQKDGIPSNAVAVIGMAGRFPGADTVQSFWRNIRTGVESISRFTDAELEDDFSEDIRHSTNFVRARSIIEDVDKFDARFFGMLPREAALTDPQHRVFLECAWEAIEDAGYAPSRLDGAVGVFAGCSMSTYFLRHVMQKREDIEAFTSQYQVGMYPQLVGALTDTLATRVSYKLNLHGPAVTVHTACSTSLYAIAQAWQNLLLYQCDMAIAGGVSISLPQKRGYQYLEGGMVSSDGHCRPFDAEASGTVFGSGAGAIFLKRLEDAIADDDHIYAVLRGCGVNNDGADKVGFTAPSAEGQAAAIAAAHAVAEISPATIGYIECHGTATPLGDPIEFEGLCKAFGDLAPPATCALGSAKANVGHLDAAAGVIGLIKTALILHHGEIPPMVNFNKPNPRIDLNNTPFYLPITVKPWHMGATPRRAGVSSFGVGGTNVHAILEEAPRRTASAPSVEDPQTVFIFPISAKNDAALERQKTALATRLMSAEELKLSDVAFTLQRGRSAFERRMAIAAGSREEALSKLAAPAKISTASAQPPRIIFMFPGQGAQYPAMGKGLYKGLAEFRAEIDQGAEILRPLIGRDIREVLFDEAPQNVEVPHAIRSTLLAQPALFLIEHAIAQQWMRWGIRPDAMIGHSVGEFVAASLAGVIAYEDALKLIAARGRLMQEMAGGAMLAVRLAEVELQPLLGPELDIAAINAPALCVAAGSNSALADLEARLTAQNVQHRRLHTSHAFHSRMMDPVTSELAREAAKITLSPPNIPYASCVTGRWITEQEAIDAEYWAQHCRAPVRFADGLRTVCEGCRASLLLEAGPGQVLSTLAVQCLPKSDYVELISSLPDSSEKTEDIRCMMEAAGRIWSAGGEVDWYALGGEQGRRISLPTYQFERERHWIDLPAKRPASQSIADNRQHQASSPLNGSTNQFNLSTPSKTAMSSNNNNNSRIPELRTALIKILEDLSGNDLTDIDPATSFLEIGFDSLLLGQVAAQVQNKFAVKVTFRQMLNDISSVEALAEHLHLELPQETSTVSTACTSSVPIISASNEDSATISVNADGISGIFQTQLTAMQNLIAQQNQILLRNNETQNGLLPQRTGGNHQPRDRSDVSDSQAVETKNPPQQETPQRFRMFNPKAPIVSRELTDAQRRFIKDLVKRYNSKTAKSKDYTEANRLHLADPRAAAGFRTEWKDLCYPIVSSHSKGSKIWDLDDNVYVDLVNGYGQTAFGHAPDFVQKAVAEQLQQGFAIGPQSEIAGEVAAKIAAFTGMERITFCNTGSEAVMAAMRIARCVTAREKVVVFNNDYHGQFDEVLVKAGGRSETPRALPLASGIPFGSVGNMVVLQYGAPESLEWIRTNAKDLAAVIVEPVQSRHPELRPFEFLRELRSITTSSETALVFDEVVTGFRVHTGGMQAVSGIRADMATYGKVLGGGMPIGVLAGTSHFMDALDGGQWRFGDDSFPETAPTFFAGTFVRHPLVLAACKAVLDHLEQEGPELQERLAQRTTGLVQRINADLRRKSVAHQAEIYSSWFMVNFGVVDRLGGLLYHYMRLLGVHIQEGFPCFLTTAHSDEDIDFVAKAFDDSIDALQSVGIFAADKIDVVPPANIISVAVEVPLTEPQTEILMAAQMGAAASCAFNESVQLRLDGDLQITHLQAALGDVIGRHEALRAKVMHGETKLIISPKVEIAIPLEDISDQPDRDAHIAQIIADDSKTPFDLYAGPLIRAKLIRLAADRHILILTAHHIVCDGWSMNIILNELAAFYTGHVRGVEAELPAVESFSDYAKREAETGHNEATEKYWLDLYETAPPAIELPSDRPRPALKSFSGASYTTHIDAALMNNLRKAGAKQGCTLFATLLGALQLMIGRLSNESDVVIACPAAGQNLVEDKVLVGHCVNFLPLRAAFNPALPAADHLKSVKQRVLQAFDHQQYTFGTLVRKLGIPRNPNRTPLTDIQFNLEKIGEGLNFAELQAQFAPGPKAAVNFDLFFNMIESSSGLRIDVDYNTDLWDASTIERWTENFRVLLIAIVKNSAQPVAELPLLGENERHWLLSRNKAVAPFPQEASIPAIFAETVEVYGQKLAVLAGSAALSYKALDMRSNQLANLLLSKRIGKGDRIALLATRSIDTIVVILAILKCGAAYVPLDASYPAEQLNFMLADSKPKLAFVQSTLMDRSDPLDFGDIPAFSIEQVLKVAENASELHPAVAPLADDPAYVMYTSGSTGRPKGVVATHRGVLRLVKDQSYAHFGPDEVMLHLAPLPFDASTLELWGSLLHGGQLAVVSQSKPSLADIRNTVLRHGVTTAWFTAALFHALVDEGIESLRPLRQILAGGDVLSPNHIHKAQQLLPDCRIINGYGPTENTTFTCCYRIPAEGWGDGSVPIGSPIERTTVYVLDENGELAPMGAVGELYTGGEGVALGYLGCPELTAERFVTDPVTRSGHLYRTGDLVRWRSDGTLEFIGRADGQVKINGFRVETGEIETVLMGHDAVENAVVVYREKSSGDKALFAYVTRNKSIDLSEADLIEALRAHAEQHLPKHMIPWGIMVLEAMPRTANDKVDRKSLPDFEPVSNSQTPIRLADVEPMSELEQKIAKIWGDVLGLEHIGRNDPIFSLGADSLHIFRIAARLADQEIPLEARHLMRNPTIADLAVMVSVNVPDTATSTSAPAPSLSSFRRSVAGNRGAAS